MTALYKFSNLKVIFFITLALSAQAFSVELHQTCPPIYQSIDTFEREKRVDYLLFLLQKRLIIMHEVARTKWNHGLKSY